MKRKNYESQWFNPNKTKNNIMKPLLLLFIALFAYSDGWGQVQDWTIQYNDNPGTVVQEKVAETVLLRYEGSSNNGPGTVMFRSVEDYVNPNNQTAIHVTMVDFFGNQVINRIVEPSSGGYFGPIAAAYNPNLGTNGGYFVCYNFNSEIHYMVFDEDLNHLQTSAIQAPLGTEFKVSDVCAVTNNGTVHFAITGRNFGGALPPHLFIAELDLSALSTPVVNYMQTNLSSSNVNANSEAFPSCIIEMPNNSAGNGGYFVSGSVGKNELFYIRAGYNLGTNDLSFYSIRSQSNPNEFFNPMTAYYDDNVQAIFVAGAARLDDEPISFFFDRIDRPHSYANSSYVQLSSNTHSYTWIGGILPGLPMYDVNQTLNPEFKYSGFTYTEKIFEEDWNPNPETKMVCGRFIETGYTLPGNGSFTSNLPTIMEIDYSPSGFFNENDWPNIIFGNYNSHIFPRLANQGAGHLDAYDPEKEYYAQNLNYHQFVKHDYNSPGAGAAVIGSYGNVSGLGVETALLSNASTMWNACQTQQFIPTAFNKQMNDMYIGVAPTSTNPAVATYNPTNNFFNPSMPEDICNQPDPFRPAPLEEVTNNPLLWSSPNRIHWSLQDNNIAAIVIYTSSGQVVQKLTGSLLNGQYFDMHHLQSALYIVEMQKIKGDKEVIKFVN